MLAVCFAIGSPSEKFSRAQGADELEPRGQRSCVLADQDARFHYSTTANFGNAEDRTNWRVHWTLVAERRVLARGTSNADSEVDNKADNDEGRGAAGPGFVVAIPMPPVRTGVVVPVELQMTWTAAGRTYQHSRPLFIYPQDPFAEQQTLLQRAQIKLFDLNDKTAELLDDYEIPHTRLINLNAIEMVSEGIVLVGEGVSFQKQKSLAEALVAAASRGVSVLCLAPSEGEFPLVFDDREPSLQPTRLVLEGEGFVKQYDKRFDAIVGDSCLTLSPLRNKVVIEVAEGSDQWSFLSIDFPATQPEASCGRLIVCNFGLVNRWQAGPVPRYLFIHLLRELSDLSLTEEK